MPPGQIDDLIDRAARHISPKPTWAEQIDETFGDVIVDDPDPSVGQLVEVKAQLTKDDIGALTQADWIRDQTGYLSWLFTSDPVFAQHVGTSYVPIATGDLGAHELWAADVAGAKTDPSRQLLDATDNAGLTRLIGRKWFVIVNRAGVWCGRLARIPSIGLALGGQTVQYRLKQNPKSLIAVQTWVAGSGAAGAVPFTYHLYEGMVGRHKLHGPEIANAVTPLP